MWLISVTERAHAIREAVTWRWQQPEWIKAVSIEPVLDSQLLKLRARYAPLGLGVE